MNGESLNWSLTISDRAWMSGLYHQQRVNSGGDGLNWAFIYMVDIIVEEVLVVVLIEIAVGLTIALLIVYY